MKPIDDPIVIEDYDPTWPHQFAKLAARVCAALDSLALQVEHVGSTAVPGLAAKPIIDMDVVVPSTADVLEVIRRLAAIGYAHEGDLGIVGREAFRSPRGEPRHHLYVLGDGAAELRRHLAFREALRKDGILREEYASLKRLLAAQFPGDRKAYSDAKAGFIERVLGRQVRNQAPTR